ncbi:TetR/AcrR family transcriptional regulator [Diaminobutyricibacter sp. McL0618]|uniref:TetR/AcrR family transcriptional regulator n=1 Tax=Leifsonia sp. McL0618 TaxID=3415677 RepID=UPI003CEC55EA
MSIPQPRAPRRDAAENREAILLAAAAALNDDIDASLETIAARAGLTRRAIYGHFATRDDLLVETFTRGAARIGSSVLPLSDPDARVEIALYGATLWAEVGHVRVAAQLAVRGPHRARVAEALEPARLKLLATVERGIADGTLRGDIEAPTLARLIEAAAIAVLDEATRTGMSDDEGRRLVMLNGLGTAGIGWREADELIQKTPVLRAGAESAARRHRDASAEAAALPRTDNQE